MEALLETRGVQPCSIARPNAHIQIGPRATAAYVKLSGFDNALATHEDWQYQLLD